MKIRFDVDMNEIFNDSKDGIGKNAIKWQLDVANFLYIFITNLGGEPLLVDLRKFPSNRGEVSMLFEYKNKKWEIFITDDKYWKMQGKNIILYDITKPSIDKYFFTPDFKQIREFIIEQSNTGDYNEKETEIK